MPGSPVFLAHCGLPLVLLMVLTCLPAISAGQQSAGDIVAPSAARSREDPDDEAGDWQSLFDGTSLNGWKCTNFGGEGEVHIARMCIVLEPGSPLTGITWAARRDKLPTCNYQLRLEARRTAGSDFFCGLTFPYLDTHASLIVGGWGGGVVGISCLDRMDASENETARYLKFEKDRWYRIRVEVQNGAINAWIDDEQLVKCQVRGRSVSTRSEVDLSQPLGIASYDTRAELRRLEILRREQGE